MEPWYLGVGGGGGPSYEQKRAAIPHWDPKKSANAIQITSFQTKYFSSFLGVYFSAFHSPKIGELRRRNLLSPILQTCLEEIGEVVVRLVSSTSYRRDCWDPPPTKEIVETYLPRRWLFTRIAEPYLPRRRLLRSRGVLRPILERTLLRPTSKKEIVEEVPPTEEIVEKELERTLLRPTSNKGDCWARPPTEEIVEKKVVETFPRKDIVDTDLHQRRLLSKTSYRGDCWEEIVEKEVIVQTYLLQIAEVIVETYTSWLLRPTCPEEIVEEIVET